MRLKKAINTEKMLKAFFPDAGIADIALLKIGKMINHLVHQGE